MVSTLNIIFLKDYLDTDSLIRTEIDKERNLKQSCFGFESVQYGSSLVSR